MNPRNAKRNGEQTVPNISQQLRLSDTEVFCITAKHYLFVFQMSFQYYISVFLHIAMLAYIVFLVKISNKRGMRGESVLIVT